mgnify:CR=1 FL=1
MSPSVIRSFNWSSPHRPTFSISLLAKLGLSSALTGASSLRFYREPRPVGPTRTRSKGWAITLAERDRHTYFQLPEPEGAPTCMDSGRGLGEVPPINVLGGWVRRTRQLYQSLAPLGTEKSTEKYSCPYRQKLTQLNADLLLPHGASATASPGYRRWL